MSLLRLTFFKYHSTHSSVFGDLCVNYLLKVKTQVTPSIKRHFTNNIQRCNGKCFKRPNKLSSIHALGVTGGIYATCIIKSHLHTASCQARKPINEIINHNQQIPFKWKEFLKYLYPHIWQLLLALSGALVVAVLNIWIPQCVGGVINALSELIKNQAKDPKNTLSLLIEPTIKLVQMYVTQAFFTFIYIHALSRVGERIATRLRQDLFKSIIMQDVEFFDKNRTGEIVSRLTSDIQDFKSTFKICISQGLRSFTQIVGCVISVMLISPQLSSAMIICMPTIIFIGALLGRSLRNLSTEAQNQIAKSTAICDEAIQNIRTVRAFAAEHREIELYSKEVERASLLYEKLGFGIGLFQAGTNLFLNSILLCTLYFSGHLMSTGQLSPGDVMAFLMATQTVQRSMSQLSVLFGTYVRGISAGARIFEYLDMPPSPMMVGGKIIENESLTGNIVFNNVKFSYPTRPDHVILKNFNLNIPAGKTVAVVGSSGNGKSTVAALLERFYDVNEGIISIDNMDIRTFNSSYLRGTILGYIDQEPILFATSILENIKYGKENATDEEVINAAKEANAHEFIMKFPNGYKTQVGERGIQLSGGQKQRIAIARALLKRPSILILDEATSALDYESERVVQKALENATKGRTVMIIAHRLSTVKSADIIVVLQRGVIAEMGTHAELIKKKGVYHSLVHEQEKENV